MKKPTNGNKSWSSADQAKLKKLADGNTPTRLIAYKLKRSTQAIYSKARGLGISLKPTNQSPYNRS